MKDTAPVLAFRHHYDGHYGIVAVLCDLESAKALALVFNAACPEKMPYGQYVGVELPSAEVLRVMIGYLAK